MVQIDQLENRNSYSVRNLNNNKYYMIISNKFPIIAEQRTVDFMMSLVTKQTEKPVKNNLYISVINLKMSLVPLLFNFD